MWTENELHTTCSLYLPFLLCSVHLPEGVNSATTVLYVTKQVTPSHMTSLSHDTGSVCQMIQLSLISFRSTRKDKCVTCRYHVFIITMQNEEKKNSILIYYRCFVKLFPIERNYSLRAWFTNWIESIKLVKKIRALYFTCLPQMNMHHDRFLWNAPETGRIQMDQRNASNVIYQTWSRIEVAVLCLKESRKLAQLYANTAAATGFDWNKTVYYY